MSKKIVLALGVMGGGEYTGCLAATVELDRAKVETLLEKAEVFKRAKAKDKDLLRMVFFGGGAYYYEATGESEEIDVFIEENWDGYREIARRPGEPNVSREIPTLQIIPGNSDNEVEFFWHDIIKHTDIRIETCAVPESYLRGLLERLD